jgi:aminoglycoside phosphotransferase (APT) family kinase protein
MAGERALRRRALTQDECERLRGALDPTARSLVAVPLLGGVDRSTYALTIDRVAGPTDLVLRTAGHRRDPAATIRHEFDILGAVSAVTDLAPAPVLVDAQGALVGEPSLVMTRLAGGPEPPGDPGAWIAQLVDTLVKIHAIPTDRLPISFDRRLDIVDRAVRMCAELGTEDPVSQAIVRAVTRVAPSVVPAGPTLIHGDYWCGNTLWVDGRIAGVVDWFHAAISDPVGELAYARLDAQLVLGPAAAEEFAGRYVTARGPAPDLAFWDLLMALPGIKFLHEWVVGYHEVGLGSMTDAQARARLDEFVEGALSRLDR